MSSDYHIHTPLCRHAIGLPGEYARVAVEKGLDEIGFADHNPMPEPFDDWRMLLEDLPRYIEMVEEARGQFPELPIRLGLECDFIAGQEFWIEKLAGMADWDYLIGSVHYIAPGWDVDNPKLIGRFDEHPVAEIWALYWKAFEQCIRSGLFDFVAHPDLVKKFGHRPPGDLRSYYEPCIAAAAEKKVAMEINTAGLRKPVGELYPAPEFLRMACEAGIPLLINSDAHAPEEVGADFDKGRTLATEAGYTQTVRFHQRKRRFVPLGE
ncbi:MAG: histidinol-phosphatase HisJ family protein [Verrucomicrobiota bacterium]